MVEDVRNASMDLITRIVFSAGDQISFVDMNEAEQTESGVAPTQNRATTGGFIARSYVIPGSHALISLSTGLPTAGSTPLLTMSYSDSGMSRASAKYVEREVIQGARAKQEMSHEQYRKRPRSWR
jgi:hypothetical protein